MSSNRSLLLLLLVIVLVGCEDIIIVACGNAFGPCESKEPVLDMEKVVEGLGFSVVGVNWGGEKYTKELENAIAEFERVAQKHPNARILYAGQSAGSWLAAMVALFPNNSMRHRINGVISFYGPLDLPTLWQRDQWGKINSPRGPILYMMPYPSPFGEVPGCDDCNDLFPQGDNWFWNVTNPIDPKNDIHMIACNIASPYNYFDIQSPPIFFSQGLEDGIIGQYLGISQARRMYSKLGGRLTDYLQECPTYPHGYPYSSPCTAEPLRKWIISTLKNLSLIHI
eukprot:TRINITY_DN6847_c0_g1_i2.p1 TRINITY_DN6847_c0_g1~~TRINITY_DN6847_c0_g1_i2.p1  ORF type:complete len:282 (-),score=25.76 TRINITY_DN6847_c0_g1_i2:22-867(-)